MYLDSSEHGCLDHHHFGRVEATYAEFESRFSVAGHAGLAAHHREIAERIGDAPVLIAGGNVIVLLNRMRLFGLGALIREAPLVAWSAGAMVLAPRILLFHDRLPQGRRDAEVLGAGFGLLPGHVVLPDTRRRLRADDRQRFQRLRRRFSPDACILIDNSELLAYADGALQVAEGARRIARGGTLKRWRVK